MQLQLQKGDKQALLIPLSVSLDTAQTSEWERHKTALAQLGFEIQPKQWQGQTRLTVQQVPSCLREQNLQQLLLSLFSRQAVDVSEFFAKNTAISSACSLAEAVALLAEIEQSAEGYAALERMKINVDFSPYLAQMAV